MAERDDLVIRVAGEAGEGVLSTGQLHHPGGRAGRLRRADRLRCRPPRSRAGIRCSRSGSRRHRLYSRGDVVDILLAFNQEALRPEHPRAARRRAAALRLEPSSRRRRTPARTCSTPLPLTEIAQERAPVRAGQERRRGRRGRGAVRARSGVHPRSCSQQRFARKGEDDPEQEHAGAARPASATSSENIPERGALQVEAGDARRDVDGSSSSGNQAIAHGRAGGRLPASTPATRSPRPPTSWSSWPPSCRRSAARWSRPRTRSSAIGMVIGASFAGKKSMTATSGPGLSLMIELLGLGRDGRAPGRGRRRPAGRSLDRYADPPRAGRPVPGALGGHGEIQRIVLAPVSVDGLLLPRRSTPSTWPSSTRCRSSCCATPSLAVRTESIPTPDLSQHRDRQPARIADDRTARTATAQRRGLGIESGYLRYQLTEYGISPMAIPGQAGGQYVATGLEHNEAGRPRYDAATTRQMTDKRFRKLELAARGCAAGPLLRRSGRRGRHHLAGARPGASWSRRSTRLAAEGHQGRTRWRRGWSGRCRTTRSGRSSSRSGSCWSRR